MTRSMPISRLSSRSAHQQYLLVSTLTVAALLSGVVPAFNRNPVPTNPVPTLSFSNHALAQTPPAITREETLNYARSILEIEPIRLAAYEAIQRILGSRQFPAIACHRQQSLNNLDDSIRQIAINYCNQAIDIVEQNDLTINRFNVITVEMQDDPDLTAQIQAHLRRLQQANQP